MLIISIRKLYEYNNYLNLLSQLSKIEETIDNKKRLTEFISNLPEHIHIYVCVENNNIIGSITLLIEEKIIHNFGRVAHIEDLVIDSNYRYKGIGSKLLKYSIEKAILLKCYKVILNCSEENKQFYLNNKFKIHEIGMALYF